MIAYHFTSPAHLKLVLEKGLTRGAIPWRMRPDRKVGMRRGFQWLTVDPDWEQDWCREADNKLPYRKNEHRITVNIPRIKEDHVLDWLKFCAHEHPPSEDFLNSFKGHRHWRLFYGAIPPNWFLAIDRNPTLINLSHLEEHEHG